MSDVEIHHDRHVVFSKQIRHGAVLVEFPEFLSELRNENERGKLLPELWSEADIKERYEQL